MSEGADHATVFEFVEAALRCGEDDGGNSAVAEDEQFHVAFETRRPPLVIFAIHIFVLIAATLERNRRVMHQKKSEWQRHRRKVEEK